MTTKEAGFDFEAVNPEELSVRVGELVTVLTPPADGWTKCRNSNGAEGFVPDAYLKDVSPAISAPRRSAPRAPPTSVPPPQAASPVFTATATRTTGLPPRAPSAKFTAPPPAAISSSTTGVPTTMGYQTKRGAQGEIDKRSIDYTENLGNWRERERKFMKGEKERLPQIKAREYYYWDMNGVRQGPLTEGEMKARFDKRQVSKDTMIAPITTPTASEALPKMSINDYFPDNSSIFLTAPIAPIPNESVPMEQHAWMYLDDSNQVQGPFTAAQMRDWFLDNYFNAETKAKLAHRKDIGFVPLGVLFGPTGENAFLTDGDQYAASQYRTLPVAPPTFSAPPPPAFVPPPTSSSYSYGGGNSAFSNSTDIFAPVPSAYGSSTTAPPPPAYGTSYGGNTGYGGSSYDDPFGVPPAALGSRSPSNKGLSPAAQSGRFLLSMAINGTPPPPTTSNPFEAPDYSTPAKSSLSDKSDDDWGILWDDEKEEEGNAGAGRGKGNAEDAVPIPIEGGKDSKNDILYATYDRLKSSYLTSHDTLYQFLTRALPKELGTIKCKIRRSTVGMMHVNYNQYELFLEKEDGNFGPMIMQAVKHKRMGFDSYFQMQIGTALATHAGTVIGEVTMTTLGTQFLLHNNVKMHSGRARDLACIHYIRTGSGGGPRKMTVAIPGFLKGSETEFVEWTHGGSIKKSNMFQAIDSLNFKDIQPLMNKPPVWSEKRNAWTLNFHGRVTRASVKNFQLVRPEDHSHVVLQHGRVGQDTFTMDVAWPLSIMQALAVCLSSLHAKLGVE